MGSDSWKERRVIKAYSNYCLNVGRIWAGLVSHLNEGKGELWAGQLNDKELSLALTRLEVLDSDENLGPEVPIGAGKITV